MGKRSTIFNKNKRHASLQGMAILQIILAGP